MKTPEAFPGLRGEVAEVVAAALKAERDGNRALGRGTYERAIRMLTRDEGEFVPGARRRANSPRS
jgi:hypothetical protein